jgi:membrane-bound ClpP family serine protease
MMLTQKKLAGIAGIILCVLLLILVGINAITWRLFWAAIIIIAGFAWFVLPKMSES